MKTQRLTGLSKAIILTIALGCTIAFASGSADASSSSAEVEFTYITVSSGETLWGLAAKHADGASQREWIANLVDLNNLTTNDIQPGQRLALPN